MVKTVKIDPISKSMMDEMGLSWHTDNDGSNYIASELVEVSDDEAKAYYEAANELYDMYVKAAEYVIENNLFFEIGVPFNLVEIIKKSWESDVHWHIYGRFDLAGGVDGKPIKLIEFNADTPTGLFETAILQWALLKSNGLDESRQFNNIFIAIRDNFKRLLMLHEDIEDFDKYYQGWQILFSSVSENDEEERTTRLLEKMAQDAGFITDFEYINHVRFSDEGIFNNSVQEFEYWFKLFPWEDIGTDEPDLAVMLEKIIDNRLAIVLNPAYTVLFQSKGMMKILKDLFPDSPYLLETSFEPLKGKAYVQKRVFGREGANTTIFDVNGEEMDHRDGPYESYKSIYQEYVEFPKDESGERYQAGVFYSYEACGLGFRRGDKIMDNMSKFVGHRLSDS